MTAASLHRDLDLCVAEAPLPERATSSRTQFTWTMAIFLTWYERWLVPARYLAYCKGRFMTSVQKYGLLRKSPLRVDQFHSASVTGAVDVPSLAQRKSGPVPLRTW